MVGIDAKTARSPYFELVDFPRRDAVAKRLVAGNVASAVARLLALEPFSEKVISKEVIATPRDRARNRHRCWAA